MECIPYGWLLFFVTQHEHMKIDTTIHGGIAFAHQNYMLVHNLICS